MNLIRSRSLWLITLLVCGSILNVTKCEEEEGAATANPPAEQSAAEPAVVNVDNNEEVALETTQNPPEQGNPDPDEHAPEATTAADPGVPEPEGTTKSPDSEPVETSSAAAPAALVQETTVPPLEVTTAEAETTPVEITTVITTLAETTEPFIDRVSPRPYNEDMKGKVVTIKLKKKLSKQERQQLIEAIRRRLNANAAAKAAKSRAPTPDNATIQDISTAEPVTPGQENPPPTNETQQVVTEEPRSDVPDHLFRRRRDTNDEVFKEDDIVVTDEEDDDDEFLAFAVKNDHGGYMDADELAEILKEELENLEKDTGIEIEEVAAGRPQDLKATTTAPPPPEDGTWDMHYGLFITIIVIASVCLLVALFYCFCIRCCAREPVSSEKTPMALEEARPVNKTPIVMSSPFTDDEMVKGEAPIVAASAGPSLKSAPPPAPAGRAPNNQSTPRGSMREKSDPSKTRNGGGQHISKPDEEYEYGIVPLEQLSKSERNQGDVEDTKF